MPLLRNSASRLLRFWPLGSAESGLLHGEPFHRRPRGSCLRFPLPSMSHPRPDKLPSRKESSIQGSNLLMTPRFFHFLGCLGINIVSGPFRVSPFIKRVFSPGLGLAAKYCFPLPALLLSLPSISFLLGENERASIRKVLVRLFWIPPSGRSARSSPN